MRSQGIEKQLRRQPFTPFRLRMSDGSAFDVRHPEMLMISRTVIALALHKPRARHPEGIVLCDPVHIICIEPVANGRTRSRRSAKR